MTLATDDILAIQKLIADYNHIVDAGDGEEFAALFTDDGSLDTGFNVVKGSNELRDFAALVPSMAPGARHMVTNVSIDGTAKPVNSTPPDLLNIEVDGKPTRSIWLENGSRMVLKPSCTIWFIMSL